MIFILTQNNYKKTIPYLVFQSITLQKIVETTTINFTSFLNYLPMNTKTKLSTTIAVTRGTTNIVAFIWARPLRSLCTLTKWSVLPKPGIIHKAAEDRLMVIHYTYCTQHHGQGPRYTGDEENVSNHNHISASSDPDLGIMPTSAHITPLSPVFLILLPHYCDIRNPYIMILMISMFFINRNMH